MKRAWSSPSSPGSRGVTSSKGKLRQDRDAVEGLLPVHRNVVAKRLDGSRGNASSTHLVSCRQTMSGCRSRQAKHQVVHSLLDRIDVPGGDPHGVRSICRQLCRWMAAHCDVRREGELEITFPQAVRTGLAPESGRLLQDGIATSGVLVARQLSHRLRA